MNTADVYHPHDEPDFGHPEPDPCICFPVPPMYWTTHYGAVDPATMLEPNPECPEHFTIEEIAEYRAAAEDVAALTHEDYAIDGEVAK